MYLWDVHSKRWNFKHIKLFALLTEAHWGTFGLGFESHYSSNPVTLRYKKYYCLDIHFLWAHVMLGAEWGNKAELDAMFKRMMDEARSKRNVRNDA